MKNAVLVLGLFIVLTIAWSQVDVASAAQVAGGGAVEIAAQEQPVDGGSDVDSQRVDIMLWTLLAAGGAVGLGLVLMAVRIAMGWTKPMPDQPEEAPH